MKMAYLNTKMYKFENIAFMALDYIITKVAFLCMYLPRYHVLGVNLGKSSVAGTEEACSKY